jgi:hypothetical protein
MPNVMMTIRSPGRKPTIDEIVEKYKLAPNEVDADFGVVEVDERDHTYAILVDASAASKITPDVQWETEGPFSNPPIEPMWPPKT